MTCWINTQLSGVTAPWWQYANEFLGIKLFDRNGSWWINPATGADLVLINDADMGRFRVLRRDVNAIVNDYSEAFLAHAYHRGYHLDDYAPMDMATHEQELITHIDLMLGCSEWRR